MKKLSTGCNGRIWLHLPTCKSGSQEGRRGRYRPEYWRNGAYAPAPIVSESVMHRVTREIIEPMHHHLRNQETPTGCLYLGLMIDEEGAPGVIEFNVRFGDPETQVTIPLISSDMGQLFACLCRRKNIRRRI